jgi:hypothetical protein
MLKMATAAAPECLLAIRADLQIEGLRSLWSIKLLETKVRKVADHGGIGWVCLQCGLIQLLCLFIPGRALYK